MKKLKAKIWRFITLISALLFFSGFLIFGLSGLSLVWAATGCNNGAGGTFSYNAGDSSSEIARKACESKYGAGSCTASGCSFFSYWYSTAAASCNCFDTEVDKYEWIYYNGGNTQVGQDYPPCAGADVTGDYRFTRVKNIAGCILNCWGLALITLGDPSTCSAGGSYRPWQNCEYGNLQQNGSCTGYALGYEFQPMEDGQITQLCGYFNGINKTVKLYKDTVSPTPYELLASASVTSANTWVCTPITPVDVTTNLTYYVIGEFPQGFNGVATELFSPPHPPLSDRECSGVKIVQVVYQASPAGNVFNSSHLTDTLRIDGLVDVEISYTETADKSSSFLLFE